MARRAWGTRPRSSARTLHLGAPCRRDPRACPLRDRHYGTMMRRAEGARAADYVPPLVFTLVYMATCLVGSLLLLFHVASFVEAFEYFSGTRTPLLDADQGR